jgi:hypothetical protein
VERCHARSVCRSAGVRRTVREVVRPRGIESPRSKRTRRSHVGSLAVPREHVCRQGEVSCLASVPALCDWFAPNAATTRRRRSRCHRQPTADGLTGVYTTVSYTNVDTRHVDASHRVRQVSWSRNAIETPRMPSFFSRNLFMLYLSARCTCLNLMWKLYFLLTRDPVKPTLPLAVTCTGSNTRP